MSNKKLETQTGKVGVPDSYVKLFAGKNLIDLNLKIYQINAHHEIIDE